MREGLTWGEKGSLVCESPAQGAAGVGGRRLQERGVSGTHSTVDELENWIESHTTEKYAIIMMDEKKKIIYYL